jgi:hypothetical protein
MSRRGLDAQNKHRSLDLKIVIRLSQMGETCSRRLDGAKYVEVHGL